MRTDELERLVSSPNPDGDRFASLVVGVFSIQANPLAQPEGRAWARLMRKALVSPTALGALQRWAATRAASLDEFYESCDASAAAGLARRAGQDAAGGRAEGVPRSKCVLLEILHPHVQEQAAESLRLARYGPAKMGGPRGEGTNKVRDEKQPQRAGQEPCLCVPNIVHCGTQNRPWASAARAKVVFFVINSFSGLSIGLGGCLST